MVTTNLNHKSLRTRNISHHIMKVAKQHHSELVNNCHVFSKTFNDFLSNIGPNMVAKIPAQNLSPLDFMDQPLLNNIDVSEVKR